MSCSYTRDSAIWFLQPGGGGFQTFYTPRELPTPNPAWVLLPIPHLPPSHLLNYRDEARPEYHGESYLRSLFGALSSGSASEEEAFLQALKLAKRKKNTRRGHACIQSISAIKNQMLYHSFQEEDSWWPWKILVPTITLIIFSVILQACHWVPIIKRVVCLSQACVIGLKITSGTRPHGRLLFPFKLLPQPLSFLCLCTALSCLQAEEQRVRSPGENLRHSLTSPCRFVPFSFYKLVAPLPPTCLALKLVTGTLCHHTPNRDKLLLPTSIGLRWVCRVQATCWLVLPHFHACSWFRPDNN